MSNSQSRMKSIDAKIAASDRLVEAVSFYSKHLETLRAASAAWPASEAALARYTRLSCRWKREADRLIQKANDLLFVPAV
jgi:hypothetical protein